MISQLFFLITVVSFHTSFGMENGALDGNLLA